MKFVTLSYFYETMHVNKKSDSHKCLQFAHFWEECGEYFFVKPGHAIWRREQDLFPRSARPILYSVGRLGLGQEIQMVHCKPGGPILYYDDAKCDET